MARDDIRKEFDSFARDFIRKKVRQIIGRAGFTWQDCEDLEQELTARLLQRLSAFNSRRGHPHAFVTTVIKRLVANILRDKVAGKRDYRRATSLSANADANLGLAEAIGQREYDARRNCHPRSDEELAQLVSDIDEVLVKLPPKLRDLAQRLMSQSISEIARDMNIPRTTLNESVRLLRRRFEKAGLGEYLQ